MSSFGRRRRFRALPILAWLALSAGSGAAEPSPLELNKPIERELAGGETHRYRILVTSGSYLRADVDQRGVDVAVRVSGPDGKQLLEVDGPNGAWGLEEIFLIAAASGDYELAVRSPEKNAPSGRYELTLRELRLATPTDRTRVAAESIFAEAQSLRMQGVQASLAKALEKFDSSLPLWKELGDAKREAETLSARGEIFIILGESKEALDSLQEALALARSAAATGIEAEALNNLGALHDRLGEKRKALELYAEALQMMGKAGNRAGLATTLNNTGLAYDSLGERDKALERFNEALRLRRELGDRSGEALALSSIAKLKDFLGDKQEALDAYQQALALVRAAGNPRGEAVILSNIGRVYWSAGDNRRALVYYAQSLPIRKTAGDRRGEAITLNGMGKAHEELGERSKALELYSEALSLSRAVGDRGGEASVLSRLGSLQELLGNKERALELHLQCLELRRTLGEKITQAFTLARIGSLYHARGDSEKALEVLAQSLALSREVGDRIQEVQSLTLLAEVERDRALLPEARGHLGEAVRIAESVRTRIGSPDLRAAFLSSVQRTYELSIDVLMALYNKDRLSHLDAAALDIAERGRARAMLELLTESRVDVREGVDRSLLDREKSLGRLLDAKVERRMRLLDGKHTEEELASATGEVETLSADREQLAAQIRERSPRYAELEWPEPLQLSDVQKTLLDDDTVLLEYALGRDHSFLWAVTPTSLTAHEIPKRSEVEAAARKVYELSTARDRGTPGESVVEKHARLARAARDLPEAAASLSRMILGAVAADLGKKQLLVVGDGALLYVPFAALPDPTELAARGDVLPLVFRHEIVTLPSASVGRILRQHVPGRAPAPKVPAILAVLADPVFEMDDERITSSSRPRKAAVRIASDESLARSVAETGAAGGGDLRLRRLPYTRREAKAILSLVSPAERKEILGFDANLAAATGPELGRYRYVHFATHGFLNSVHPELSGLVFSLVDRKGKAQAGFLPAVDVFNLKLPAELVVLSGCQTALGTEIKGEGLLGLTRGFMYAGARRVLASLWKVDDAATAELMRRFYDGVLGKEKLAPAAALRRAQISMSRDERWKSPYYWAGFTLQGDWK